MPGLGKQRIRSEGRIEQVQTGIAVTGSPEKRPITSRPGVDARTFPNSAEGTQAIQFAASQRAWPSAQSGAKLVLRGLIGQVKLGWHGVSPSGLSWKCLPNSTTKRTENHTHPHRTAVILHETIDLRLILHKTKVSTILWHKERSAPYSIHNVAKFRLSGRRTIIVIHPFVW